MKHQTPLTKLIGIFITTCFVFLPSARAVDPPPDGGYPNQNTAEGEDALLSLTSGFFNTAVGYHALLDDTSGSLNTALGAQTLLVNTTGRSNTATGSQALLSNSTGQRNTATGADALLQNNTGSSNTAIGTSALVLNLTGFGNTAAGREALANNSSGNENIAIGLGAGGALTSGSHNIDVGNRGVTAESNTIRIGTAGTQTATYVAGISGATVADGIAVVVGANGHLGTITSSASYKDKIKPMEKASEAILSLRPVSFRYKEELDPKGIPQFGLVAEDVAKVAPDLVARDEHGKPYTVRYEAVNAMLLNEFLKAHRKVEEQGTEIAELKSTVAELKSALKEQAAQIRQVSAQIAVGERSTRLVSSNE